MRKIILGVAITLDYKIEGPAGEIDWCFTDQDYGMKEFLANTDALMMGRKTFELTRTMPGGSGFPQLKEYIFSRTLKEVPSGSELIGNDFVKRVLDIKNSEGRDIWLFGGADLATSFLEHKLIDELWLSVHPVILGAGKPLFHSLPGKVSLELTGHKIFSTGLVSLKYKPVYG